MLWCIEQGIFVAVGLAHGQAIEVSEEAGAIHGVQEATASIANSNAEWG